MALQRGSFRAKPRGAANKALELDPNNAEAYVARATVEYYSLETTAAAADFERALVLAPENVDVLNFYGDFLEATADLRRAEKLKRQAMALDPLAFVHPMNLGDILADQGRYEEAMAMFRRAVNLGENSDRSVGSLFWMQVRLNRFEDANKTLTRVCAGDVPNLPGHSAPLSSCFFMKAGLLAATGKESEAAQVLAAMNLAPVISAETQSSLADFYANELRDIRRATVAAQRAKESINFNLMLPLVDGLREARLPEEISQDPEWLAVWSDPKLREWMEVYRANLTAFRNGK